VVLASVVVDSFGGLRTMEYSSWEKRERRLRIGAYVL